MELGLEGKVALVTGASKGIGKAIADALAAERCRVVLCARGEDDLEAAAEGIRETGGEALAVATDMSDADAIKELVGKTNAAFGGADILVNNAGGTGRTLAFDELTDEDWTEVLELNILSAVRLTRAVLPGMREKRWGRVINIASESGIQPDPFMPHYNASKAALINLTKSLSKAYAADGILVNAVSPAMVRTPLVEGMFEDMAQERGISKEEAEAAFLRETRPHIVLERPGEAEETAAVVVFLASEAASFVTGSNYRVDGGSVASIS